MPTWRSATHRADDPVASTPVATLAHRLGYDDDTRLLILSAELLGSCHAANQGVYDTLRSGLATTASLMMPCPWARHAAAATAARTSASSLTLNAELDGYRWGPITQVAVAVRRRWRLPPHRRRRLGARRSRRGPPRVPCPDRAGDPLGFRHQPSHRHLDVLQPRPEFFDVYARAGGRLRPAAAPRRGGGRAHRRLSLPPSWPPTRASSGPTISAIARAGARRGLERMLFELEPGVTEVLLEPARRHPGAASDRPPVVGPGRRPRPAHQRQRVPRPAPAPRASCSSATASCGAVQRRRLSRPSRLTDVRRATIGPASGGQPSARTRSWCRPARLAASPSLPGRTPSGDAGGSGGSRRRPSSRRT